MNLGNKVVEKIYKPFVQGFLGELRTFFELAGDKQAELKYLGKYWAALEVAVQEKYPRFVKDGILYAAIREWMKDKVPDDIVVINDKGEPKGINYRAVAEYITRKYAPVYFKKTLYVYKDGFYVEGEHAVRDEVRNLILEFWPDAEKKRVIGAINEVMGYIIDGQAVEDGSFPFNPFAGDFIPLLNGVYWVEKEILLPHSPYWLWTYKIPWSLDRSAECPSIDKFFSEIVAKEDIPLLYEFPALALMQEPGYARAYMLVGSGGNGKSTYLKLITMLLGKDNVAKVSLQDLNQNRFAAAELAGKLANIFPDLPPKSLKSTSIFKAMTGADEIYVEKKFKDPFSLEFRGRLAFSTNQLPAVDDESYAFWRRWVLIDFPHTFPDDPLLMFQLRDEIPGLLNKVVEYIRKIKREGPIKTKNAEEIMEKWRTMADTVYFFVKKRIVKDKESEEEKDIVYSEYTTFCEENDIDPVAKSVFGARIQQYTGAKSIRRRVGGTRKMFWKGIRLIREDEVTDDGTAQSFLEV